jgi:hypothetical protein
MGQFNPCPEVADKCIKRLTHDALWTVIHESIIVEEKLAMSWNAINQRGHPICPFSQHKSDIWRAEDGEAALETLMFIISTAPDLVQNYPYDVGSTQPNENFHPVKSKYCEKRVNFWTLSAARFAITAIEHSKQSG